MPDRPGPDLLTERERDVARLVATGRSNAEIAAYLHIAVGTVKGHLAGIHARLATRNRVEIAVWAHETGLAGHGPVYGDS
jgi:DNA-binding CsgD family transcriptional regulator